MRRAVIVLSVLATVSYAADIIAFVFEDVRHGARAPLLDEPEGYFKVPTE